MAGWLWKQYVSLNYYFEDPAYNYILTGAPLVGGIIATFSFLQKDAPLYRPGYIICISFICLSAASCVAYLLAVWYENRRRDRKATIMHPAAAAEIDEREEALLGDLAPTYRYNY